MDTANLENLLPSKISRFTVHGNYANIVQNEVQFLYLHNIEHSYWVSTVT